MVRRQSTETPLAAMPTGIYSDLDWDKITGDCIGMMVEFVRAGPGYQAIVLLGKGDPYPHFSVMDSRMEGDSVVLCLGKGKPIMRGKLTPYAFTVSEGAFTKRAILKKYYETEASRYKSLSANTALLPVKYSDWHYTDSNGSIKGTTIRLFMSNSFTSNPYHMSVIQFANGEPGRLIVGSPEEGPDFFPIKGKVFFHIPKTPEHGAGQFHGDIGPFELKGTLTLAGVGETTMSLARVGDY